MVICLDVQVTFLFLTMELYLKHDLYLTVKSSCFGFAFLFRISFNLSSSLYLVYLFLIELSRLSAVLYCTRFPSFMLLTNWC